MSKHIKLAKIMDLMTIYCEKHIFLRFSRVMPKQVLNHLNCEYSTERLGPFAAISAKIDLFLANLGLKSHYFIDYQKLSKLVFFNDNRKYFTEEIMSKHTRFAEIIVFLTINGQKTPVFDVVVNFFYADVKSS